MTGDPWTRKPWTSSGPLPPIHTVAAKSSMSWPELVCVVLIPQAGRGTRSGSADFGGFARYGTSGAADSDRAVCAGRATVRWELREPLTTVTSTVAAA